MFTTPLPPVSSAMRTAGSSDPAWISAVAPKAARDDHRDKTDGSRADHRNSARRREPRAGAGLHTDSQRLYKGSGFVVNRVRKRVGKIGGDCRVFAEGAIDGRGRHEHDVPAEIVPAGFAQRATAAGNARLYGDALPGARPPRPSASRTTTPHAS